MVTYHPIARRLTYPGIAHADNAAVDSLMICTLYPSYFQLGRPGFLPVGPVPSVRGLVTWLRRLIMWPLLNIRASTFFSNDDDCLGEDDLVRMDRSRRWTVPGPMGPENIT
jgi:hypothetical protein